MFFESIISTLMPETSAWSCACSLWHWENSRGAICAAEVTQLLSCSLEPNSCSPTDSWRARMGRRVDESLFCQLQNIAFALLDTLPMVIVATIGLYCDRMTVSTAASASKLAKILPLVDHRVIGQRQKLFFFSEHSKGSCFFLPRGARVYNKLVEYLRAEYLRRNYQEVITPNIYDCRLWERSGHWDHYKDNMIRFHMGEHEFSLKPMNCPGHCLMYQQLGSVHSDQLPLRLADFGVLHRNELSGSITGLTRMRRFQQDDAHIFCRPDQVRREVSECLDFARQVYTEFGFKFQLALSLRPKKYMGDPEMWDQAEGSLREALAESKLAWSEQKFEGAFYGPKIDLTIKDVHERTHQCATIQLDFQLPTRFELVYKDTTNDNDSSATPKRPVMIHRAILGSIERFMAMIMENSDGRWPFWLSPVQALVVPIHSNLNQYALQVQSQLVKAGFGVDCDLDSALTMNKKIREAELTRYNFVLVVGNKEAQEGAVTVRSTCDKSQAHKLLTTNKLIDIFRHLDRTRASLADQKHAPW